MNRFHLKDIEVKRAVERIWAQNHQLGFLGKLRRVVKHYKLHCIRKAKERKEEEDTLRRTLSTAREGLHRNPQN